MTAPPITSAAFAAPNASKCTRPAQWNWLTDCSLSLSVKACCESRQGGDDSRRSVLQELLPAHVLRERNISRVWREDFAQVDAQRH